MRPDFLTTPRDRLEPRDKKISKAKSEKKERKSKRRENEGERRERRKQERRRKRRKIVHTIACWPSQKTEILEKLIMISSFLS
jgi:hypothetical protein